MIAQPYEHRHHPRVEVHFLAELSIEGLPNSIEAVTDNVSQGGAYIKTEYWDDFEPKERILATFYLPASFTGQEKTIALQGESFIARVDPENEGVGLQFVKPFRQFNRL